ncbi:hypothetical protein ONZ45_g9718 [Pleurotus djamor]|nr:hypothetical protein ONZ45_g9718 [Pleurotus djamor]
MYSTTFASVCSEYDFSHPKNFVRFTDSFERVHEFSASRNYRTVALNRRDYGGSTAYADPELDDLKNGRPAFLHAAAITMAHFVAYFVQENDIPLPDQARVTGGVIVVGWSSGALPSMLWLEGSSGIPPMTCKILRQYVTRLILYDPPYFALGLYLPKHSATYDPWRDPDCKTPEELVINFKHWVSSYYEIPKNWAGDLSALDFRKRTERATTDQWTEDEHQRYFDIIATLRSEMHIWTPPMLPQIKGFVTRCLYDEKMAKEHLPNIDIIYISCLKSCWHTVWATHEAQRIYQEYEADGIKVRPMYFKTLEEANHFVHYDNPELFLDADGSIAPSSYAMATIATTLHLPDGNDVYYIDSGPVAGCKDYTTLILVHGSVVNARSFDRVHEIAGKNRLRTVALNRRDYPGTTRYTDDELADLKLGQEAVLQRTSVQLAHFITEFINLNDIPLPGGHGTGGVVVVGWSMGVASVLSLFAYPTALPPRCHDALTRYVRSLVLYDPPYLAFGMELPGDTSIYNIWSELDSKPHEEVYRSFGEWVSSYFDVPENWSGSINDLDGRKSTGRMTVLSQEDQNRSVSLDVAMRSETFCFLCAHSPCTMAATFDGVTLIVDNTDPNIKYNEQWSPLLEEPIWYGGTYVYSVMGQSNATIELEFSGTSIACFGHGDGKVVSSLDDGPPSYTSLALLPQTYQSWFRLGDLSESRHALSLSFAARVYLDYIVITPSPSTPLQGRTLMVDDKSPSMNYTGDWVTIQDQAFDTGDGLEQPAQGGTLRQSKTVGDRAVLLFTGSSVSVYGIVQWKLSGRVSTAYIVDGSKPTMVTIDSEGPGHRYTDQPNYPFFHTDLPPGNHTLVIVLTEVAGEQSFMLDYVVYSATFDNVTVMPRLSSTDMHPWDVPPLVYPHADTPVGAIVGSVTGGVVFLCVVLFLGLVWWRKRKQTQQGSPSARDEIDPDPDPPTQHTFTTRMSSINPVDSSSSSSASPSTSGPPTVMLPLSLMPRNTPRPSSLQGNTRTPSISREDYEPSLPHSRHVPRFSMAKSESSTNTGSPISPASPRGYSAYFGDKVDVYYRDQPL